MVRHQSVKFGSHRQYGGGDIMFLVDKGQDTTCPRLDPVLLLSLKHMPCSNGLSNEGLPILVMHVYKKNWRNLLEILFHVRPKTALAIRKRKTTRVVSFGAGLCTFRGTSTEAYSVSLSFLFPLSTFLSE